MPLIVIYGQIPLNSSNGVKVPQCKKKGESKVNSHVKLMILKLLLTFDKCFIFNCGVVCILLSFHNSIGGKNEIAQDGYNL